MPRGSLRISLAAPLAACLIMHVPAAAETSSWEGRVDGPAEAAPKKARPKPTPAVPAKVIRVVPASPTALPFVAPPAASSAVGAPPSTAPATSSAPDRGGNVSEVIKAPVPGEDAA